MFERLERYLGFTIVYDPLTYPATFTGDRDMATRRCGRMASTPRSTASQKQRGELLLSHRDNPAPDLSAAADSSLEKRNHHPHLAVTFSLTEKGWHSRAASACSFLGERGFFKN